MARDRPASFRASPRFAARTPLLPLEAFTGWAIEGSDLDGLRDQLAGLLALPEVAEAIFIASPDLHRSIEVWRREPDSRRGQRVERALVRYLSRMATRATPFGLFAAVSTGRFAAAGEPTALELPERAAYRRSTRIDNDYLFALCEALVADSTVRDRLELSPNSSLYVAAGRYRYAEARHDGEAGRSHHLVTASKTDYLTRTLERAAGRATRGDLAAALVADDPEIELDEALAFIDELIDSQVLTAGLSPNVTGPEPIHFLIDQLRDLGRADVTAVLEAARDDLARLDERGPGAPVDRYLEIAGRLGELPAKVELGRLFQVDTAAPMTHAVLSTRVAAEIERAVATLARITPETTERPLTRFRDAFAGRFESREVPLLEALDEEAGIGYDSSSSPIAEAAPLLAGLRFPAPPAGGVPIEWSARHAHLLALLARAGDREAIELIDADIDALAAPSPARLADAISVMATVAAPSPEAVDRGDFALLLEGAGGPSGARILGRFCLASSEHEALVREHLAEEEALFPEAVFAEIAHLPEGRIGNILCRPVLRDYEIAFLGISGAPADRQLPVSDLLVSVRGDRVVLRSRRLDREVIPRMTTAHNFSARSLGVYRFLCDLQNQGTEAAGWSWGPLASAPFTPRVTYGRHVMARARWRLSATDLEPLAEAARGAKKARSAEKIRALRDRVVDAVRAMREARRLPRHVVLADGDNELAVDFENPLSVDSFVSLVKNRSGAELHELFPGPGSLVVSSAGGGHVHQLVVPLIRQREPDTRTFGALPGADSGRFVTGSQWLYAKLYTGTATADDVLRDEIWPLARDAVDAGEADRWFFIRYGDPDWHLRVRFCGEPDRLRSAVLPRLQQAAARLAGRGQIWRFQLDTYMRETSRYGGDAGSELAEELFFADSVAVAEIVELLDGDEGEVARWQLALRGIDTLLADLGFDLASRRELIGLARDGFAAEFRVNADLGKQLGVRYREHADQIAALCAAEPDPDHPWEPGFAALERRSQRQRPIAEALRARQPALTTNLDSIALSLVHMHVNRLLRSAHRAQELVLYDLLKRHYDRVALSG